MKKLLLTAVLGLGLGGGAWKYHNPEGTVEDFRAQATATVDRMKVGVDAVRASSPSVLSEKDEQESAQNSEQEAQTTDLTNRLAKLEEAVSTAGEDQPVSNNIALSASNAKIADAEAKIAAAEERVAIAETNANKALEQQADIQASLSALEKTVESLQASMKSSAGGSSEPERIDAIDNKLELLTSRIDEQSFDADISGVKEGLQVLGADVLDVQSTLKQQNATIAGEFASVNDRTSAIDTRMDTLAMAAQSISSNEKQSSGGVTDEALAGLSAGMDKRFGALEDQLQTVNADSRRIGGLDEQLLALQTEIASLKKQYADTDRSLSEMSANIDGLKTASESMSIETVQTEIRDQLASAQSQLESDRAVDNSAELEALVDTTRNRIRTLEQRVQDLPASEEADAALKGQTALESQMATLEKRLETINQTDPDLANTISNVQQQVEQLAAQGFVTQEELKAQSEGRTIEYKIFFESDSSRISDSAAEVLASFIEKEKNHTTGVSIFGFTDRSGSAVYNQRLAVQRATIVRSYLIQNGMDYTKINSLTGLGEDAAAVLLPDNAEDSEQRVVVLYAQQP